MNEISERILVARCKAGDEAAFAELIKQSTPAVRRAIRSVVPNPADAEDVMQDALFNAFRGLPRFNEECKFSTWLSRIAINNALLLLRRRRRMTETSLEQEAEVGDGRAIQIIDPGIDPEQALMRDQAVAIVQKAVRVLPIHLRQYTRRRWFDELPHKEAASSLGISLAAGKARSVRARRRLGVALAQRFGQSA